MSRKCELTGCGVATGNNVSHSKRKIRREFAINLCNVTLNSVALKKTLKIKIASRVLRTIDFFGGVDAFLLHTKSAKLTPFARKMKRKLHEIKKNDAVV